MMRRTSLLSAGLVGLLLCLPAGAAAQNREQQQLLLDMRMLQEQTQQLQLTVNALTEQLKTVNAKLAEQANTNLKRFADQEVLINNANSTLGTMSERLQDNNVRVAKLSQDIEAIRQGLNMLTTLVTQAITPPSIGGAASGTAPGTPPPAGATGAATPPVTGGEPPATAGGAPPAGSGTAPPSQPATPPMIPASASTYFDQGFGFYIAAQYDLAIASFDDFIQKFPTAPDAPKAQFFIGQSYMNTARLKEAVDAYEKVIKNDAYKASEYVPEAYYKQGLCYEQLKQPDLAEKNFRILLAQYPESGMALLARQELIKMGRIKQPAGDAAPHRPTGAQHGHGQR